MKKLLFVFAAILLLLAGCVQYEDGKPVNKEEQEQPKEDPKEKEEKKEDPKEEQSKENDEKVEEETTTKKDEPEKENLTETEEFKSALDWWEKEDKDWWIEEHSESGVVDIQPLEDDFSMVSVIMANELKMLSEGEKQYVVDEVGKAANNFVAIKFGHAKEGIAKDLDVVVEFYYEDGSEMASQRVLKGGWKIK